MRRKTFAQLAACALIGSIGATLAFVLPHTSATGNSVQESSVQEALGSSVSPLQERLYSPTRKDNGLTVSMMLGRGGKETSFNRYLDGTTEDVHLFKDGRHWAASESYFATLPDGARQLHSEATFAPLSGEPGQELYTSHRVYRPGTGSLKRFGHRYRDGRYEQIYYFDDGFTPARDRYFDALLDFFTETVYRWKADHTGTYAYARLVRADFEGQFYVSLYREDGSRYATIKQAPGMATGELFAADGSTLLAEWGQQMGQSYYILYDAGSQVPVKEWNSVMGRTTVTVASPVTHRVVQQQIWQERPDPSQVGGRRYLLMSSTRFGAHAEPIVRIDMSGDGKHPTDVITPEKNGERVQKLDDSGRKVVGTEVRNADGETTSALVTQTGEAINIDPTLLAMPGRLAVPTFTDDGPPRLYDYSVHGVARQ